MARPWISPLAPSLCPLKMFFSARLCPPWKSPPGSLSVVDAGWPDRGRAVRGDKTCCLFVSGSTWCSVYDSRYETAFTTSRHRASTYIKNSLFQEKNVRKPRLIFAINFSHKWYDGISTKFGVLYFNHFEEIWIYVWNNLFSLCGNTETPTLSIHSHTDSYRRTVYCSVLLTGISRDRIVQTRDPTTWHTSWHYHVFSPPLTSFYSHTWSQHVTLTRDLTRDFNTWSYTWLQHVILTRDINDRTDWLLLLIKPSPDSLGY